MSATHSSLEANASKWRLTKVGRALLSRRAARGARGLGASDSAQAQVAHEAFDGTAGHVTGTVTLGDLGSAPLRVHLAGPRAE